MYSRKKAAIFFLLLAFLSTFLLHLPFLGLSSGNSPIVAVSFIVFYNLLVSLSQLFSVISRLAIILTMCPAHFIRLLTILQTVQALVPICFRISFILLLSTLFTSTFLLILLFSTSRIPVVCVVAILTWLLSPSHKY